MTIIHVKRGGLLGFVPLSPASPCINTETIASPTNSLNLHDGSHGCIILCTRIGDKLYALDVSGFQLIQFFFVAHLPAIDVNDWRAFAEDFVNSVLGYDARHVFQHIVGSTNLAERGVCDVCHESLAAHLELGDMTFHNDLTECLRVRVHLNVTYVALSCVDILCYISYTRYFQQTIVTFGGNRESSVILRYGSSDESGVGTVDKHNVDKRHRLGLLVNHPAADVLCCRDYRHEAHH